MSWLTDLAGKAEDFLNKVDQSAAVALKKEESNYGRHSPALMKHVNYSSGGESSINQQIETPVKTGILPSYSSAEKRSPSTKRKSLKEKEDEELFEFLNSSEVAAPLASQSSPSTAGRLRETPVSSKPNSNLSEVSVLNSTDAGQLEESIVKIEPFSKVTMSTVQESSSNVANPSSSKLSSLELENRLLRSEISSLSQELQQSMQKTQNVEAELNNMKMRLEQFKLQLTDEDKQVRGLKEHQSDLQQTIDAKDSQLAVLKVRLQEADEELIAKRETVERLQDENRRILDDHSSSSGLQFQAIQTIQDRLRLAEERLEREEQQYRNMQGENLQRVTGLEEELRTVAANYSDSKSKLHEEKLRNSELSGQFTTTKSSLEMLQQEFADYKSKAQRILQSKERLIASLKESNGNDVNESAESAKAAAIELEELRHERDLLKDDLSNANRQIAVLRTEIQESETNLQREIDVARDYSREVEERLSEERSCREDVEQEKNQLKEELRYLREDSARQQAALQSRVGDRDAEIERLRKQLMAKQVNSSSHGELETRLNALTESLIQKQTMLEALSTEKSALIFQLEKAEQKLKEESNHLSRNTSTAVSLSDDNDVRLRVASFMTETPFDGQVTRKMKRVYNRIDMFSFRLGIFLRRYPIARILIIIYMFLLHFWVMVVLLTYSPEIHDKECIVPNKRR